MSATRYLDRFDVTREDLAGIAVKNHRNARDNPRAQLSGDHTVADVLASRPIADPLTLLQCSPVSNGAGAVIVRAARDVAAGDATAVRVLGSAFHSGAAWPDPQDRASNVELIERTAADTYAQAGARVEDLGVLEVHDAFTIGEIVTTKALGLAPEGGGAALARSGATARAGRWPVNPSGGLLARGHPLGATGTVQVAEVVWQLTGRAGARQVADPRLGLVETMGGNVARLSGNGCIVQILAPHT